MLNLLYISSKSGAQVIRHIYTVILEADDTAAARY